MAPRAHCGTTPEPLLVTVAVVKGTTADCDTISGIPPLFVDSSVGHWSGSRVKRSQQTQTSLIPCPNSLLFLPSLPFLPFYRCCDLLLNGSHNTASVSTMLMSWQCTNPDPPYTLAQSAYALIKKENCHKNCMVAHSGYTKGAQDW